MAAPALAATDANEAVIFEGALEGVLRSFGPRLTPELRAGAKALGIDFEHLLPAYPMEKWEQLVRLVAASLFPGLPEEQQWERMGFEFMEGYLQTLLGRAALAIGRVIGPRRTMERMGRNFRTAGNYLHAEAVTHGPTDVEVTTRVVEPFRSQWANRPTVMLAYRIGVLRGAMFALGVPDARVEVVSWDPVALVARYRVRW